MNYKRCILICFSVLFFVVPLNTGYAQGFWDQAKEAAGEAAESAANAAEGAASAAETTSPKAAVLEQFGSNRTLEQGAVQLRRTLSTLREVASTPPSPYDELRSPWRAQGRKAVPEPVEVLTGEKIGTELGYRVETENHEYRIYKVDGKLIPYDAESNTIPVDQRLNQILRASAVRGLSRPVSRQYFETIERVSDVTLQVTSLLNRYGEDGLDAFREIESASVMGVSAMSVIDELVKSSSGGVGVTDLKTALERTLEQSRKTHQRAKTLNENANKVREGLRAVRGPEVPLQNAQDISEGMDTLGTVIRKTAQPYTRMRKQVEPIRDGVQELRGFTDIAAVQFAATTTYHIERSVKTVESQVESYASTFTRFPTITDRMAMEKAQTTRTGVKKKLQTHTERTLTEADTLHTSLARLTSAAATPKTAQGTAKLKNYQDTLRSKLASTKQLRSTDAAKALQAHRMLKEHVEALPVSTLQSTGEAFLQSATQKQLIGTPDTAAARAALTDLGSDPAPTQVAATTATLTAVWQAAERANRLLYLAIGGILLAAAGISGWRLYA